MLLDRATYDRLVQETADAREYAETISGVSPVASSEAETEIRLRSYHPRPTHDSGVHERVKAFCLRTPREVTRELTTVYLYDDNMRRVVNDNTMDEHYERKTTLYPGDSNNPFGIKCVVSREDTLIAGFKLASKPTMVRKRDRMRISYEGLFIDLTTTTVSGTRERPDRRRRDCDGDEPTVRYEVELEIPDINKFSHDQLNRIVRTLFRVVRDTEVPYPMSFYKMMAEFHNSTLGQDAPFKALGISDFDTRLQSRARTLKLKDLVYGGIVSDTVHYSVTPKADGVRTTMMLHSTGVWLYYGNGLLNCLSLSKNFDDLHGTIIDVESIPMANRAAPEARRFQHFLVAFDTLALNSNFSMGSTAVQNKDHQERMFIAENIMRTVEERLARNNPLLAMLRLKTFYYSFNVDSYFDAVASARHLITSGVLPYKTDGLVFTPSNLRSIPKYYAPGFPLHKRVLSDSPDVIKWKSVEQLTIDFAVDVRNRELFASGMGNSLVKFTARGFNSVENVAWIECEQQRIPKNAIFEFEWRDHQFHPLRPRADRDQPNRLDVSRDNFERIQEGVTYDTIAGLTGILMARYHNRVKTMLYTTVASARARLFPDAKASDSYSLLDLGSGFGGDISKWHKAGFTHVIAVEPSHDNAVELRKRLAAVMEEGRDASTFPQVDIVETTAENTDAILTCSMKQLGNVDAKVDVISSMLSASFFWKDDETLAGVVRTIKRHSKQGTTFVVFTINGQRIEEMISPSMREGLVLESPLTLGDITFDFPLDEWEATAGRPVGGEQGMLPHATGRSYHITFAGSKTVHAMDQERNTAQREYMVYIPMLSEALKPEFKLKSHEIADKEPLLLGPYRIASSLYSYAIYERVRP